jgi:hypothetical protein
MKIYIDFARKKDKERLWEVLKNLDKGFWITVERNTRSQKQNNYYFGVVVKLISDHTGHTCEEVHDELARRFNPQFQRSVVSKKESITAGKTSELTINKFWEYTQKCVAFASTDLNIFIPEPNEIMEV